MAQMKIVEYGLEEDYDEMKITNVLEHGTVEEWHEQAHPVRNPPFLIDLMQATAFVPLLCVIRSAYHSIPHTANHIVLALSHARHLVCQDEHTWPKLPLPIMLPRRHLRMAPICRISPPFKRELLKLSINSPKGMLTTSAPSSSSS